MSLARQIKNQPEARALKALGWHICVIYSDRGTTRYRMDKESARVATPDEIAKWERTVKWYAEGRKADQP